MTSPTISQTRHGYVERVERLLLDLAADERTEVLQDLQAHIIELDEHEIERVLGTPEAFVREFRESAGLDDDTRKASRGERGIRRWVWVLLTAPLNWATGALGRLERRLGLTEARIALVKDHPWARWVAAHWIEFRPVWLAVRGWLAVSLLAGGISAGRAFERFPFPSVNGSTLAGILVVAWMTSLSYKVDKHRKAGAARWDRLFTNGTLTLIGFSIMFGLPLGHSTVVYQEIYVDERTRPEPAMLVGTSGPLLNIHAYDIDGNPVEVLLYDNYGQPIQLLPNYAYEQWTNLDPELDPFIWEGAQIRFKVDRYGRPLSNLYPYERYQWTESGVGALIPPPLVGIPETPIYPTGDVADVDGAEVTVPEEPIDPVGTGFDRYR